MSNYLKRLTADDKAVKTEQAELAAAHAKASVEQEVSSLKAKAATLTAAYNAALGANPFNVRTVFNLTKEIADNKANLTVAETILSSEFAD